VALVDDGCTWGRVCVRAGGRAGGRRRAVSRARGALAGKSGQRARGDAMRRIEVSGREASHSRQVPSSASGDSLKQERAARCLVSSAIYCLKGLFGHNFHGNAASNEKQHGDGGSTGDSLGPTSTLHGRAHTPRPLSNEM